MTAFMTDQLNLFSQEAEEAVIGSILISPNVFPSLQGFLRASDFYLIRHRILWQTFARLAERSDPIELTTVVLELQDKGQFEDVGEFAGVMKFLNVPSNSMHAEAYARLVQRTATRRAMMEAAEEIYKQATDEGSNIDVAIARFEQTGLGLRRRQMSVDTPRLTMQDATLGKLSSMFEAEKRHASNPNYVIGVRTGVTDLDLMLDGLRPGVTTLAAATGMGKTGLALQIVRFASRFGLLRGYGAERAKTHFFSGEMTQDQLMNRLLSSMTGVPVRHIERGSYTSAQKDLLVDALHDLDQEYALSFESAKRMNTAQIRQRVRSMVMDNELDFLALDGLLQIEALAIDASDTAKQKNYMTEKRRDLIEAIMNDLEDITLTYNTPILLTHQLSRAPGARQDKRPILSDLAEASFVEQKSAVILFLYRAGYYDPDAPNADAAEIICSKNRFGITGTIDQIYESQYTRFIDADRTHYDFGG